MSSPTATNVQELVKKLNSHPRTSKSGPTWHFDIRYIQLQPPSHILFFFQPDSQYIHNERLPISSVGTGHEHALSFFPESGYAAAPQVARGILQFFANGTSNSETPTPATPWKFTTECSELAKAVGAELKRLGVRPELSAVGHTLPRIANRAQTRFSLFFKTLKESIPRPLSDVISTPEAIVFSTSAKPSEPRLAAKEVEQLLAYVQSLENAKPPQNSAYSADEFGSTLTREMNIIRELLEQKPQAVIKADADDGDPIAALDYALRLHSGLRCTPSRTLSREYLVKAIASPTALDGLKATAHGLLITWCTDPWAGKTMRSRYLFEACHHANEAARLCELSSPRDAHASPAVLWFMSKMCEPFSADRPEIIVWYKDAWAAHEKRRRQMAASQAAMEHKRLKDPNRYRCAAVGCGVEADTGKVLSRCSGKCDPDKKPSYCGKACQRADWPNHKPFCMPGAPCSVIDQGYTSIAGKSSNGAVQIGIPVDPSSGLPHTISSSTISPEQLKEIRDSFMEYDRNGGTGHLGSSSGSLEIFSGTI